MQKQFRNPLKGKPRTVERMGPDGKPVFRIVPRELTPYRAKLANQLTTALTGVLILFGIFALLGTKNTGLLELVAVCGVCMVGNRLLALALRMALRSKTEIEMTTDTIKVRRWLLWRSYNRLLEHRFALLVHDGAQKEARDLDYESRQAGINGQAVRQTPYYAESFHVVLLYAGQRIDLLSVYGPKEAAAIVARLQYCDRLLYEAIAMSGGISKRPEDDWTAAPGGIHHG